MGGQKSMVVIIEDRIGAHPYRPEVRENESPGQTQTRLG